MKIIDWYKEGHLTWRNPFALLVCLTVASTVLWAFDVGTYSENYKSFCVFVWCVSLLWWLFMIMGGIGWQLECKKRRQIDKAKCEKWIAENTAKEEEWENEIKSNGFRSINSMREQWFVHMASRPCFSDLGQDGWEEASLKNIRNNQKVLDAASQIEESECHDKALKFMDDTILEMESSLKATIGEVDLLWNLIMYFYAIRIIELDDKTSLLIRLSKLQIKDAYNYVATDFAKKSPKTMELLDALISDFEKTPLKQEVFQRYFTEFRSGEHTSRAGYFEGYLRRLWNSI